MPVVEAHYPPETLYEPCEEPKVMALRTVGDVTDYLLDYRLAFDKCASKVRNIRKWVDSSKNPSN